ncbi:MAG: hypothetical protein JW884_07200 [Deltaproteobacteria bacterium]|nr:hypothetical protein [Deltaproteobacteria bacterium]
MKRVITACEILIVLVILLKVAALLGMAGNFRGAETLMTADTSLAQTTAVSSDPPVVLENPGQNLERERDLYASLLKRQSELEAREAALREEEQRIQNLKGELLAKIEELRTLENKVAKYLSSVDDESRQRIKSLAKVYESSPPVQAAATLEKLDRKTAAFIVMNMKSDKAGAVMGYMTPQTAVDITKELTEIRLGAGRK